MHLQSENNTYMPQIIFQSYQSILSESQLSFVLFVDRFSRYHLLSVRQSLLTTKSLYTSVSTNGWERNKTMARKRSDCSKSFGKKFSSMYFFETVETKHNLITNNVFYKADKDPCLLRTYPNLITFPIYLLVLQLTIVFADWYAS